MSAATQRLDDCLSIRGGRLYIEGCEAEALARDFGTPLYVVSEDQLRRNVRSFIEAFAPRWPGPFELLPSIKANSTLALRRVLTDAGTGCDVFGSGELEAALRTGTDPRRISLNGPTKDEALLRRAIEARTRITLDSVDELERTVAVSRRLGLRAHVRLRFRPDLVGFDMPSEMSADGDTVRRAVQRYKAGIPTQDLEAINAAAIADPSLDVAGIMLHLGRHLADPALWRAAVDALRDLLPRLHVSWDGWTPREVDLGGGFPVPRDPFGRLLPQRAEAGGQAPSVDDYAEQICVSLAAALDELGVDPAAVQLELEPGRALYGDAGVHLATVGNVKRQSEPMPMTWVETDTSDTYLADVNLEHNRWTCIPVTRAEEQASMIADVTGRTCALDVVIPDARLPEVTPGEVLAFLDTGAYQDASASNFNALPRPGTALVSGDEAEMVRRHETLDDVFARDMIPSRLGDPWRATEVDHVSVTSGDLDRSLAFYRDLLGLRLRATGEAQGDPDFEVTGLGDARVRWADLELADGRTFELIEYLDPRGSPNRPAINDPGTTHISLRVGDIRAAYRRLHDAGLTPRTEPIELRDLGPWQGARCFYTTDPDGITIELIQTARP